MSQLLAALGSVYVFALVLGLALGITLAMGMVLAYLDSQDEGKW